MAAGTSASPPSGVRIARSGAEWAKRGVGAEVLKAALAAYDRMIGLDLDDISVDGSITKSFCGGDLSGRSPVDRGKQGTRRSVATDGSGIPLALVAAGANRHDSPLFEPTMRQIPDMIGPLPEQPCVHPDRGYDSTGTRGLLDELGYGNLRRCTEKRRTVAECCGLRLTAGREHLRAVVPTPCERALLQIDAGVAAFTIDRLGLAGARAVERRTTLIRGDRFSVTA